MPSMWVAGAAVARTRLMPTGVDCAASCTTVSGTMAATAGSAASFRRWPGVSFVA